MKIDGEIAEEELKHITAMIKVMEFGNDLSMQLLDKLETMEQNSVDFDLLKENDETISVLIDMVALAKADKKLHKLETVYIRQAGKKLGVREDEIDELLSS